MYIVSGLTDYFLVKTRSSHLNSNWI